MLLQATHLLRSQALMYLQAGLQPLCLAAVAGSLATKNNKEGVEPFFTFYETRYPKEPSTYS